MRLLKTRGHQMNIHLFYIFNKSKQLSLLPHNTVVFMCVAMLLMSASALRGQKHHIWSCRQVETPGFGADSQTWVPCKSTCALHHRAITPASPTFKVIAVTLVSTGLQ